MFDIWKEIRDIYVDIKSYITRLEGFDIIILFLVLLIGYYTYDNISNTFEGLKYIYYNLILLVFYFLFINFLHFARKILYKGKDIVLVDNKVHILKKVIKNDFNDWNSIFGINNSLKVTNFLFFSVKEIDINYYIKRYKISSIIHIKDENSINIYTQNKDFNFFKDKLLIGTSNINYSKLIFYIFIIYIYVNKKKDKTFSHKNNFMNYIFYNFSDFLNIKDISTIFFLFVDVEGLDFSKMILENNIDIEEQIRNINIEKKDLDLLSYYIDLNIKSSYKGKDINQNDLEIIIRTLYELNLILHLLGQSNKYDLNNLLETISLVLTKYSKKGIRLRLNRLLFYNIYYIYNSKDDLLKIKEFLEKNKDFFNYSEKDNIYNNSSNFFSYTTYLLVYDKKNEFKFLKENYNNYYTKLQKYSFCNEKLKTTKKNILFLEKIDKKFFSL